MKKLGNHQPWLATAFLMLALTVAGKANAEGEFEVQPTANGNITDNPFSVSWTSTEPQQWIRAFNATTGNRFYDSGRLLSPTGVVSINIPTDVTQVRVVFYERISGVWFSQESVYGVDLSDGGGGIIASRISCEVNVTDLPTDMTDPGALGTALEGGPTASCALECPADEILVAPVCNPSIVRTYPGGAGPVDALVGTINYGETFVDPFTGQILTRGESLSSAACQLRGQFDRYYDFSTGSVYPYLDFRLSGSATCLSAN